MLFEIIFTIIVLLTLATYYLVAVPVLTELTPLVLGSNAVQAGGHASTVHLIFDGAILFVPLIMGVGIIIWLVVSATHHEAYRGRVR